MLAVAGSAVGFGNFLRFPGLAAQFGGGAFMAAFVLFFQCFPRLFWQGFFFSLSETAQLYLCNYVPRGYAITLGGCTYTNYILFIGLAVCCGYLACGKRFSWKSVLAIVFGGVFLYAILLVGRRGELLVAVLCLALMVLALCSKKQRRFLIIGGIAACVVGFAAIVALLPWLKQFPPMVRYVMTIEQLLSGQDITSGRLELYALAWNSFLEHPILGIGWDRFYTLVTEEFQAIHGYTTVEDVHNIYLQFLTETGLVGTPLLIAPLVYLYSLTCAQLSRLKKQDYLNYVTGGEGLYALLAFGAGDVEADARSFDGDRMLDHGGRCTSHRAFL